MFLARPAFMMMYPGPSMMLRPALPKRPEFAAGTANALRSNHAASVDGYVTADATSGLPPTLFVFDGSDPANCGFSQLPVDRLSSTFNCHPPRNLPCPKGNS